MERKTGSQVRPRFEFKPNQYRIQLERQVQRHLNYSRAADRVLNHAKLATWRTLKCACRWGTGYRLTEVAFGVEHQI
jgi:hypothetical protein